MYFVQYVADVSETSHSRH